MYIEIPVHIISTKTFWEKTDSNDKTLTSMYLHIFFAFINMLFKKQEIISKQFIQKLKCFSGSKIMYETKFPIKYFIIKNMFEQKILTLISNAF